MAILRISKTLPNGDREVSEELKDREKENPKRRVRGKAALDVEVEKFKATHLPNESVIVYYEWEGEPDNGTT